MNSINTSHLALDPSVQPTHSLEVSTLLRKSLLRNAQVSADGETVLCVREQAGLVSLVTIKEDLLNVRPVLGRVALVQSSKGDADGRGDGVPLLGLSVRGVGGEAGFDAFAFGEVASDVSTAETVADGADLGGVVGRADRVEGCVDDGFDLGHWVALLPVWEAVV